MKRLLAVTGIIILGLVILVFLFISPIVKYVIEKNSVAWTGRTIRIEHLFLNIFGGGLHLEGFSMLEQKSDSVFIRVGDLDCNISINSLLQGQYVIEKFHVTRPEVTIVQRGDHFNFDDLLLRFAAPDTAPKTPGEPVAWFIE